MRYPCPAASYVLGVQEHTGALNPSNDSKPQQCEEAVNFWKEFPAPWEESKLMQADKHGNVALKAWDRQANPTPVSTKERGRRP